MRERKKERGRERGTSFHKKVSNAKWNDWHIERQMKRKGGIWRMCVCERELFVLLCFLFFPLTRRCSLSCQCLPWVVGHKLLTNYQFVLFVSFRCVLFIFCCCCCFSLFCRFCAFILSFVICKSHNVKQNSSTNETGWTWYKTNRTNQ